VLGTAQRLPLRFAAFANGVSIHMEDFDDTQLAVASDRVYGQLTHPTAPCFRRPRNRRNTMHVSGKQFMLGYHIGVEVALQDCGGLLAPGLQKRLPFDRRVRRLWQHGGLRQAARL